MIAGAGDDHGSKELRKERDAWKGLAEWEAEVKSQATRTSLGERGSDPSVPGCESMFEDAFGYDRDRGGMRP